MGVTFRGKNMYMILLFYMLSIIVNLVDISIAQTSKIPIPSTRYRAPFNRSAFPDDFVFGTATSAYQIEGGVHEGGKGASIWDTFVRQHPEKIWDSSNGDVANDFYHRYKEDIKMVKDLGMDAFRMSISWTRILPSGRASGGVSREGINFYNRVINELIANGLQPFVTIFHWDLPQALEDEYGGLLHPKIVEDYRAYAEICFKEFGDRVKHWITLNEPLSYSMNSYAIGTFAPGRCSKYIGNCAEGNSATEPYIVAHHFILCHGAAVQLYKAKYQKAQKGVIGVTLVSHWFVPINSTPAARKAAQTALDFFLGWFLHPVTYGQYPTSMITNVGHRLPKFSAEESNMLRGSIDFLGINYYTSNYATPALSANRVNLSYTTDNHALLTTVKNGVPIGTPTCLNWLFICPSGIKDLMLHIMKYYKNLPIYITENGMAESNNSTLPVEEAIKDGMRIRYYEGHLWYLQRAIKLGANVKGHFVWSMTDDFEWDSGYTVRFGLSYIDYKNGLKRIPKLSYYWFKKFLKK